MTKRIFILGAHPQARGNALECVRNAPEGFAVTVAEPTRSLEQNARLWSCLHDISQQVVWHGRKLDSESWKHIFTSALKKMEVVPNLDGTGFVALGLSTSRMSKREMADLMTLIDAFGGEREVQWSEPKHMEPA